MNITDYLNCNLIFLDLDAANKDVAIAQLVELMSQNMELDNPAEFLNIVQQREKLGNTGIGHGIALPHARSNSVKEIVIAMARLTKGVEFDSDDKIPVRLIFLIGTPLNSVGEYLKALARLSRLLRGDDFRKKLLTAETSQDICDIFNEEDS